MVSSILNTQSRKKVQISDSYIRVFSFFSEDQRTKSVVMEFSRKAVPSGQATTNTRGLMVEVFDAGMNRSPDVAEPPRCER